MNMPLHPTCHDIAVRLLLTMLASGALGFNRGTRGHAAGFRTTILVGLAAAVAMIQANILLSVTGKTSESFGVMDLMRLPLGILTGVGFIGGGTILKRGELVHGVTTAATLWVVTVIGLCFGGGQLVIGLIATVLCLFVLWVLKSLKTRIRREHRAELLIAADLNAAIPMDLNAVIGPLGYHARFRRMSRQFETQQARILFELIWKQPDNGERPFGLLEIIGKHFYVESFEMTSEDSDYA